MSLVSTWVQATDGRFYQDPILSGEGWFVCFDDDDPPELVVQDYLLKTKKPWDVLYDAGIPYKNVVKGGGHASRNFSGIFKPADSFFFDLTGPIPVPFSFDEVADDPRGQGVYYRFKRPPVKEPTK